MYSRRYVLSAMAAAPLAAAPSNPSDLTITEAAALIRRKSLTPLELTEACLQRIERQNPSLNAFITVLGDSAIARARSLRPADAARQPLHGIPIALKDLYDTAEVRTTAASNQWRDRVPTTSATVVQRLEAAGAILIGKANMDEFAYNFTSETSAFGPARNPWDPTRTPGGSSGGSAIAVASGMSLAALGSDTGGSIRLPAAFCGVTGFKPTYGRIPLHGVAPLSWSLDHPGPLTRSAADAAVVHGVLRGQLPGGRPLSVSALKSLRIGLPRALFWDGLEPDVDGAIAAAITTFSQLCREVRDVTLPRLAMHPDSPLPLHYSTVIFAEAYTFHLEMLQRHQERYHPGTRASIELGKPIDAASYIAARREIERARSTAAEELFGDADLLLTPTAPGVAFPLGSTPDLAFLRNTAPWNLYGLPTVSIPCGFGSAGLPIGLQLSGPPDADEKVLAVAAAFLQARDVHQRVPPQ